MEKITINSKEYQYIDIKKIAKEHGVDITKMPFSIKILLENVARNSTKDDIKKVLAWVENKGKNSEEIEYLPYRVLMQDFTGVPAIVDLAAMRDATKKLGGEIKKINPIAPVHLVIDHSIQVDFYGNKESNRANTDLEIQRNRERYEFLKWGQNSLNNLFVVPPGTGICHQINIEHIASVVAKKDDFLFFDTLVGTDSHTTMANGIGVLGWGVGGIEAESVMLGQPVSLLVPEVIGFKLEGNLQEGVTATDLILTITQMLRKKGVVGKFVEFYGEGLKNLSAENRTTIANMAPEYGATCGIFPIDEKTIDYLFLTGRSLEQIEIVKEYAKKQEVFGSNEIAEYTDTLYLDISSVKPCVAGPKRPQDKLLLNEVPNDFLKLQNINSENTFENKKILEDGSVVIAAITSCTNTSNPSVLIGAGLLAKKAVEKGLKIPNYVKTSLAPGSRVAEEYLAKSGLQHYLDTLGFNVVGFGCTTCIGNSGPLQPEFEKEITEKNLTVASVLSGNRNFEGRVHALVKANYLASPPLVVAYALLGNVKSDIQSSPLGKDLDGNDVFLKDIWPTNQEIEDTLKQFVTRSVFEEKYKDIYKGTKEWQEISISHSETYSWKKGSTYIENPPYFDEMQKESGGVISDIINAKPLLILGDSITTDHISPAGDISKKSPAAEFLRTNGVEDKDFNSYGARRGSHSVMMRGTFANIRIKNEMLDGVEGGYTKDFKTGETVSVYEMAMRNKKNNIQAVVIAGKEYGTGSSRDWAAKGTYLLGVKAVIAESFERIHRSNLIGMGVIPFEFIDATRKTLNLTGNEQISIANLQNLQPMQVATAVIKYEDGSEKTVKIRARVDTNLELDFIKNGGIMQYVIRNMVFKKNASSKKECPVRNSSNPLMRCIFGIAVFVKKLFSVENCCNNKSCGK